MCKRCRPKLVPRLAADPHVLLPHVLLLSCPALSCPSAAAAAVAVDPPRAVTIAVTSDRGLCGGLNSNITKYTKALLAMYKGGE